MDLAQLFQQINYNNEHIIAFDAINLPQFGHNLLRPQMRDVKLVIKKDVLDKLKVHAYEKFEDKDTSCSICVDEFYKEDIVRLLPCNHIFHRICIDKWLLNESYMCPVCRKSAGEHEIKN